MARIKFLAFALLALGLWAYQFTQVIPLALTGSTEQAQAAVAGAAAPVALAIESRRSLVQAVALKLAGGPASWNGVKGGAKVEAPGPERLATVRAAASELVPDALKNQLVVAMANDAGAVWAKGDGDPSSSLPAGLVLSSISTAGAVATVDTVDMYFVAVPWVAVEKGEVKNVGSVLVGLPLLPETATLDATVRGLGLRSLAVAADGTVVIQAGEKPGTDEALTNLKTGAAGPLSGGPVRALGPLELPLMTASLAHSYGSRQSLSGTGYEVLATASMRPALQGLASNQVFALGALVGLVLFMLAIAVMLGSEEAGPAMVVPPPMPLPPVAPRRDEVTVTKPLPQSNMGIREAATPPEATPEDFDFPDASAQPASPPVPPVEPTFEHRSNRTSVPEESSPLPPPVDPFNSDDQAEQTVAYPPFQPPPAPAADPFASSSGYGEENPEATRVAAVPAELIRAARAATATDTPAPDHSPGVALPKVASVAPAGSSSEEERHFQDIFRDFVSTREKCGEPPDGLTFDKFKLKLLKTKDQLVAKHQCRTIRFQVYVKDGKAALKAAPVKD